MYHSLIFKKKFQSSNGIYVGLTKIPPNTPYTITETDVIGIGWTMGISVTDINDHGKFVFKLVREAPIPIIDRIQFQSDNELDNDDVLDRPNTKCENTTLQSPVLQTKNPSKRKIEESEIKAQNVVIKTEEPKAKKGSRTVDDEVIDILSDSDSDNQGKQENVVKKSKLEELPKIKTKEVTVKTEQDDLEYDAFQVKQEQQSYDDDDPIYINSESEDDESVQWLMRLSQSSPGKPFIKIKEPKAEIYNEENSYSQIDDEEEFHHDLIFIPSQPQKHSDSNTDSSNKTLDAARLFQLNDDEESLDNLISTNNVPTLSTNGVQIDQDEVDGMNSNYLTTDIENTMGGQQDKEKKVQMIQPLISIPGKKTIQSVIMGQSRLIRKHLILI